MQELFPFRKLFILQLFICLGWAPARADRVRLEHADQVRFVGPAGERITHCRGAVRIKQGEALLLCDEARIDPAQASFEARGAVRYTTPEASLEARVMTYEERRLSARGEVRWTNPETTLRAEKLFHWRDEKRTTAIGQAHLLLARQWFGDEEATGAPVEITADTLSSAPDSTGREHYRASGHVRIVLDDVVATAERADFARTTGRLDLSGEPRAERDPQILSGEHVIVRLEGGEIVGLEAVGDALFRELRGAEESAEIWDEVSGDSLHLALTAGEAQQLNVLGNASSLFHPEEDLIVWNRVGGTALSVDFADRKAEQVRVRGQVSGTYSFMGD